MIIYMNFTSKSLLNRWGTPATTNSTVRNYRAVRRKATHVASNPSFDNTIIVNSLASNINTLKSFFESSYPLYTLCLAGEKETIGGDLGHDLSVGGFIHLYAGGSTDYDSLSSLKQNMINTVNAACIDVIGYDAFGKDLGTHTLALVLTVEEPGLKLLGYGNKLWNDLSVYGNSFKIHFRTTLNTAYWLEYESGTTTELTANTGLAHSSCYYRSQAGNGTDYYSTNNGATTELYWIITTKGGGTNYLSRHDNILRNNNTESGTGTGMLWNYDLTYANFDDNTGSGLVFDTIANPPSANATYLLSDGVGVNTLACTQANSTMAEAGGSPDGTWTILTATGNCG